MKIACVFPGQGSQFVGMCRDVIENFAVAKQILQEVDDSLNQKLSKIILEGPAEELTMTENTQPALMACSIAVLKALEQQLGKKLPEFCSYVAGHSLGEFTALTAAGVFSVQDCARLVKIRGKAMQESVPLGQGAMFALLGAEFEVARDIAAKASKIGICQIANDNCTGQQVLSGSVAAIEEAMSLASQAGNKAIRLNVSAPFHCKMMQPAQDALQQALHDTRMSMPSVPLIANITAKSIADPVLIKDLLVQQVTGMVRWRETVLELKSLGVTDLVEIGPGKVLSGMTKRIDASINSRSVQTVADIVGFES